MVDDENLGRSVNDGSVQLKADLVSPKVSKKSRLPNWRMAESMSE